MRLNGLPQQIGITLRLYYRNTMGLIYGYLFPTIFLVAFWVLYRYDRVPLVRHLGELLTVTVLGGACFGLPTTMVSERERGVWRRYRLTPVPTATLVAGTVIGRYIILITAGVLQVVLARLVGMPWPPHPLQLLAAFTAVAFAFLGLGLVIATLADNVPAVQALGQCIFLPMLIIGGVAVQLASLPAWAQHLSAFFPGRYAVEAIQACVTGKGLGTAIFDVGALAAIGVAGGLAGAKLFRWDAQQRFMARTGKSWVAVAVAAWIAVGLTAEAKGRIGVVSPFDSRAASVATSSSHAAAVSPAPEGTPPPEAKTPAATSLAAPPSVTVPASPAPSAGPSPSASASSSAGASKTAPSSGRSAGGGGAAKGEEQIGPPRWDLATMKDIEKDIDWEHMRLPPDSEVVTPIARSDDQPDQDTEALLEQFRAALADWPPGKVTDPVQKVRNYLYVAAVIDVLQLPTESFVPAILFQRMQQEVPRDTLIKVLYWIALHPDQGDVSALDHMIALNLPGVPGDLEEVQGRVGIYAVKLLGRLIGKIQQQ